MYRAVLAAIIFVGLYHASTAFRSLQENATGSVAWTTPANGRIVDGVSTTLTLTPGDTSNQLELWFPLSVSSGAAAALQYITGLEIQVTMGTNPGTEKVDCWCRLYEHTSGALTNWKNLTLSGGVFDTFSFGGDGDFWLIVPTWTMIQSKNFGIQFYCELGVTAAGSEDVEVDGFEFRYHYNRRYGLASQGAGI